MSKPPAAHEPLEAPAVISDAMLMTQYAQGDAAAFNLLYARHQAPLYRYVLRLVQAPQVAGDVFQDAWLKLVQASSGWRGEQMVAPWLYTVARNRALDHLRALKNQVLADPDFETQTQNHNLTDHDLDRLDIGHLVHNQQLGAALIAAIEALPLPQRDAFALQADAGMDLQTIAELTHTSVETVKSRLRYAKTALRAALKQGGWHD